MAAKIAEQDMSGARRARAISAIAAFVLLGLGLWRGAEVFTQPAQSTSPISVEQEKLLHVIEPLAGAGNVRLTVRRADAGARDFLVMIDTASSGSRGIGEDIEGILEKAAGFDAARGDTLTVQEFPFVGGATARPNPNELAQLGVIGLLVFLLSWGAFAPAPSSTSPALAGRKRERKSSATDAPGRPRPVAVDLTPSSSSSARAAAKTANENPVETAKVIRAWMRSSETP